MTEIKVIVERGNELSEKSMKETNDLWENVFSSPRTTKAVNPSNIKTFINDTFFIVKDKNEKVLSAGRLRPVEINFLGKTYLIQGIADIASAVQGKGNGKALMTAMRNYLKEKNQLGLGFCKRKNSLFYKKCGYEIAPDSVKRFVYKHPEKKLHDVDVLFFNDNGFMKAVLENPKETVFIPVPHW
ncbi:MAG: GNAT family N-acetyltransferase [archaeon]